MNAQARRVAWYRLATTFSRRRSGLFALILLIGVLGGLAMGALAGSRRTQSSFATYLESTNPSNLSLGTALLNPALGYDTGINPSLVRAISHLPLVRAVRSYDGFNGSQLTASGTPRNTNANVNYLGSVDGEYFDQDRVSVTHGRMADPGRADEVMMTPDAAHALHWRIGETLPFGFFSDAQSVSSSNAAPSPDQRVNLKLVGTVVFNDTVVEDQIDSIGGQNVVFTPALTSRLAACCSNFSFAYLRLEHGRATSSRWSPRSSGSSRPRCRSTPMRPRPSRTRRTGRSGPRPSPSGSSEPSPPSPRCSSPRS